MNIFKFSNRKTSKFSILLLGSILVISTACGFFSPSGFSDFLRGMADDIDKKNGNSLAEGSHGSAQSEGQSAINSSGNGAGNSSSEGSCDEYKGLILFDRWTEDKDGNITNEIVMADENGNIKAIIPGQNEIQTGFGEPVWSPNHCRIAFSARNGLENNINMYTMDPDGSNVVQLTDEPTFEYYADWSPDGKKIVYVVGTYVEAPSGNTNNTTMDNQENAAPASAVSQGQSSAAAQDTSNSSITFQNGKQTKHLWIMNADGSDQHLLTDVDDILDDPEWSPDGKQIVFECLNEGSRKVSSIATLGAICLIDPDGKHLKKITPQDEPRYLYPAWSPDGKEIVVNTNALDTRTVIGIMNADGSNLHKVTVKNSDMMLPLFKKWSPDGKKIIFMAYAIDINGTRYVDRLIVLDLKNNTVAPFTEDEVRSEGFPDW